MSKKITLQHVYMETSETTQDSIKDIFSLIIHISDSKLEGIKEANFQFCTFRKWKFIILNWVWPSCNQSLVYNWNEAVIGTIPPFDDGSLQREYNFY